MSEYQVSENVSAQLNVSNVADRRSFNNNAWVAGFLDGEPRNARLRLKHAS